MLLAATSQVPSWANDPWRLAAWAALALLVLGLIAWLRRERAEECDTDADLLGELEMAHLQGQLSADEMARIRNSMRRKMMGQRESGGPAPRPEPPPPPPDVEPPPAAS